MANDIITRAQAKEKGLVRYFTGSTCSHAHVAERQTSNGVCLGCRSDIETRYREAHPEKMREKWRNYEQNASTTRVEAKRVYRRKYDRSHREEAIVRKRAWVEANRSRHREHGRQWAASNKDKVAVKNKRYKTEHAERLAPIARERSSQWAKNNPEQHAANQHVRRARKKGAGGNATAVQLQALFDKQCGKCANCFVSLTKRNRHLDHIKPLSKGGSHDIANLQYLCQPCNNRKHAKDPFAWAMENGRLL